MKSILYDTHVHTSYSTDSHTSMEQQIQQAAALGLQGICFTDHMDYEFPPEALEDVCEKPPFCFSLEDAKKERDSLQNRYPMLQIGFGVECGLQKMESVREKNQQLVTTAGLDYVIGSLHLVDRQDPYYKKFWEGKKAADCIRRYFEQILENISFFHNFDSLGHLDYIVRYAPEDFCYQPHIFTDIVDEILRFLIKKDIALEINTSGLRSLRKQQNPHIWILKKYRELGGELITIGSDGHAPDYLAFGFEQLLPLMESIGFRQYITFEKRNPVFHSL